MNILEALRSYAVVTVASSEAHIREYAAVVRSGLITFQTRSTTGDGQAWSIWSHTIGIPERAFLSANWAPWPEGQPFP